MGDGGGLLGLGEMLRLREEQRSSSRSAASMRKCIEEVRVLDMGSWDVYVAIETYML